MHSILFCGFGFKFQVHAHKPPEHLKNLDKSIKDSVALKKIQKLGYTDVIELLVELRKI